jgi:hypothetical protein
MFKVLLASVLPVCDMCVLQDVDLSIKSIQRRHSLNRSMSTGVIVGSHLPHLVCMDDDILSTGVVIYQLKVGMHAYHVDS